MKTQEILNQIAEQLKVKNPHVAPKAMSKKTAKFIQKNKETLLKDLGWVSL